MNNPYHDLLYSCNYWEEAPRDTGYDRKSYVDTILDHFGAKVLKVLVGQRRSGKSYVLKQIISLLLKQGVPKQNILYLNFELYQLQFIQNADTLAEIISAYYHELKPKGKVYLFFDEIQEVTGWEKIVNSYLANDRFDVEIILTGSNAHLLSTELSTFVTGRYIEIAIYPFSYYEYLKIKNAQCDKKSVIEYIESSGIPELFNLKDNKQKTSYLTALRDSILMNDIIKRFNIKNPKLLILIFDFLIDNVGHLFSVSAIVKKIKRTGINLNAITVSNYVHYLEMTYFVHAVSRYDLKGKKILEGERKYYMNDLAYQNYILSKFDNGINKKLENFVYLVLRQAGYKVYVGNFYQYEIDFVAEKNGETLYIQVTYLLHSKEVIEREYGNLDRIKDNWPKWVVSLDDVSFSSNAGIEHVPAWKLVERISNHEEKKQDEKESS